MRGKVEVFSIALDGSEELVLSEPNLVVNGAGESIVDMLTTPSSVLGISPRVMDTSNWRWGALSFGPAASSFQENAYSFDTSDNTSGISNLSSIVSAISGDHKLRVVWASGTIGAANGATVSSYTPPYRLPSYPAPLNYKLEDASTAYVMVSGDGTKSFGQFENRMEFKPADASSYFQGVFPRKVAKDTGGMLVSAAYGITTQTGDSINFQDDPSAGMIVFASAGGAAGGAGQYNVNEQMDYRGFVSATYGETDQTALGNVYVSGSVGAGTVGPVSQSNDPRVSIYTTISAPDVWAMNLYGGLHQIGLWNVDCTRSLDSNEAPFIQPPEKFRDDTNGVSKLEFKLFAKKSFTQNMCHIKDYGNNPGFNNPQALKIVWTIDFRSQHD